MREQLSSRLTIIYKIIGPIFGILSIGIMVIGFLSHDPLWFISLAMLIPIFISFKVQKVTFDKNNLYVNNWWSTKTYALRDIKAINERDFGSLDPFFEIEIWDKDGTIIKVDFLPKVFEDMDFFFTKKYTGQLEYFRDQIIRSKRIG